MIKTFEDYKKEHLGVDADGLCAVQIQGLHGLRMGTPGFEDFEQVWDFCQERAEKKEMLISELAQLLNNPLCGLMEQVHDQGTDPSAIALGNNINRINKILIALQG